MFPRGDPCKKGYTGETGKQTDTRKTEHAKAIFTRDVKNDALAAHSSVCDCTDRLEETQMLAVEPVWYKRKVRGALESRANVKTFESMTN